jgi:hypothetical protein
MLVLNVAWSKLKQSQNQNEAPHPGPLPILLRRLRKMRRGRTGSSASQNYVFHYKSSPTKFFLNFFRGCLSINRLYQKRPQSNWMSWCEQKETGQCVQKENKALRLLPWVIYSIILSVASAEDKALRGRNLSAA